jgi:hypothetical protein
MSQAIERDEFQGIRLQEKKCSGSKKEDTREIKWNVSPMILNTIFLVSPGAKEMRKSTSRPCSE